MKRLHLSSIFVGWAALIVLAAPAPPARPELRSPHFPGARSTLVATGFDDVSETEALATRAHNLTNLTAVGIAPFRLEAALFFNDPSGDARIPPARGKYVFTWAAPDKWREDAELLHLKQTEIASGTALWTKRNAPYPSHNYWWTRNAMAIVRGAVYHFDSHTRVEISQVSGRNVVCAKNGGAQIREELCLDTVTALPFLRYDGTLNLQYTFAEWTQWGNRWYPHKIQAFNGTQLVLRVEISNVGNAPPESKWLAPPPEATQREWCPDMRPARLSDAIETAVLPDPNAPPGTTPLVGAIVYGVIEKDGSWLDLSVLESPDFKAAYEMLEKLREARNLPATCRGVPVESETVFRISPQR